METTELANLIKDRRSIRAWEDKPVPEELLLQAVELATWAPNGANAQLWYFYIVLDKSTIKSVADAAQAGRDTMASWPEMAQAGGFPRPASTPPGASAPAAPRRMPLGDAPAMILVGARKRENPMDKVISERAKVDEKATEMLQWGSVLNPRIQSVSAGIAYLLLVLHQMGLGATWMTGPLAQSKGDVEKILKVPDGMDIVALIPVGYPADSPTGQRRPVSEVCEIIK
ncbi:MAG: nitroreductase family protein [Dehalococcoidales bacterium]|nr:MAG: nitroreductase family protein [Dehalococcoidales bacterium]